MLGDASDSALDPALARLVADVRGPDLDAALMLASRLTELTPLPGSGRTGQRWELLAQLAARDLTCARVVEAHLDAVAILAEAAADASVEPLPLADVGADPLAGTTWGVFAAEGPGTRLLAEPTAGGGWRLHGVKPWCSVAGSLSHALVTAHRDDDRHLFAISLRHSGVAVEPGAWHARGMVDVPSGPVRLDDVPAVAVGAPGWYLRRPGFTHGGSGVAACWFGAAVALGRALLAAAARREPDQLALWHLGEVDLALSAARAALRDAARAVDGEADGAAGSDADGELVAARVRGTVAAAAEQVLIRVGHALGPAPLALDDEHARRVADLTLYLRQHHAERDVAALGRAVLSRLERAAGVPGELAPW